MLNGGRGHVFVTSHSSCENSIYRRRLLGNFLWEISTAVIDFVSIDADCYPEEWTEQEQAGASVWAVGCWLVGSS